MEPNSGDRLRNADQPGGAPTQMQQVEGMEQALARAEAAQQVRDLIQNGLALAKQYIEANTANAGRRAELDDKRHKRSVLALVVAVGAVFVLCLVSLMLHEGEMAKLVLQSGLAVAAGAGVAGLWRSGKRDDTNDG